MACPQRPSPEELCAERNLVKIEVGPLTSLMGVGSVGRMIVPKDSRFRAWIGAPDAAVGAPTLARRCMDSLIEEVKGDNVYATMSATMQLTLMQMARQAETSLMTAMIGPPGTGKTTHIAAWRHVLLRHHNTKTPTANLRICVCAPTNHAVLELEHMVAKLADTFHFTQIRIIKRITPTAKGKGKGKGK